jgi:hypothetical protein
MPRLSTLSNPTGLIELDKQRIGIFVDVQPSKSIYSLNKLDLENMAMPAQVKVVVVARRGNAELRKDHGITGALDKGFVDITELGNDGSLRFRVLLVASDSPKLVAVAENVRPDGLGDSESLIGLESADLGQVPWELEVLAQEGRAIIRFNRSLYSSAAAAETDRHFASLVFPEALRQLAVWHTQNEGALALDEWEPFKNWLIQHGITEEPDDEPSSDGKERWCRDVVRAFCGRFKSVDLLRESLKKGDAD